MGTSARDTDVLGALRSRTPGSLDEISTLLYAELREIAHRHRLTRGRDGTLATTALVHEVYLKLVDQSRATWTDRAHFLALAAVAMRHILSDRARARMAVKRGRAPHPVTLDEQLVATDASTDALLEIEEALDRLGRIDGRLATIVECRFFGGLTHEEIAEALGVTVRTVEREWAKARILLRLELMA
jgi:RNA polymerase sigma factor (TIGR02999 family)